MGHGKGGHFFSLHTVATALSEHCKVTVINIGVQPSPVLNRANAHYGFSFIPTQVGSFGKTYKTLAEQCSNLSLGIIHAFDIHAFLFGRRLAKALTLPLFLTKSGGKNPTKYYPSTPNLVLFSKENRAYFTTLRKYNDTNILLIPNRVLPPVVDDQRIKQLITKHGLENELVLLRIGRISNHYETTIWQGLRLAKALVNDNLNIRYLILGTVQSELVLSKVKDFIQQEGLEKNISIETEDQYTHNASELLGVGNLVLGTGRNFMEACAQAKKLLVPYQDGDHPLLVTSTTFENVAATNFSPRTHIDHFNAPNNYQEIHDWVKSRLDSREEKEDTLSLEWFEQHFSIKTAIFKYLDAYQQAEPYAGVNYWDYCLNYLYTTKDYLSVSKG